VIRFTPGFLPPLVSLWINGTGFLLAGCHSNSKKGKSSLYSLPSIGPGANPSVQAVSPQVTTICNPPGGRLPLPGLRLPSQPQSITAPWPVPRYTAWWQRHIGVNNLPKVVTHSFAPSRYITHNLFIASPMLYPLHHCATSNSNSQSTNETQCTDPIPSPHPFIVYHQTYDARGVANFVAAIWRQDQMHIV